MNLRAFVKGSSREVLPGEAVTDFRGDTAILVSLERPTMHGKSGKVRVRWEGADAVYARSYYDNVFDLIVYLDEVLLTSAPFHIRSLAAEYASAGAVGSHLAQLATTGEVDLFGLLDDIASTIVNFSNAPQADFKWMCSRMDMLRDWAQREAVRMATHQS